MKSTAPPAPARPPTPASPSPLHRLGRSSGLVFEEAFAMLSFIGQSALVLADTAVHPSR